MASKLTTAIAEHEKLLAAQQKLVFKMAKAIKEHDEHKIKVAQSGAALAGLLGLSQPMPVSIGYEARVKGEKKAKKKAKKSSKKKVWDGAL